MKAEGRSMCWMSYIVLQAAWCPRIQFSKNKRIETIRPIHGYLIFVAMANGIILVSNSGCLLQVYSLRVEFILYSTIC